MSDRYERLRIALEEGGVSYPDDVSALLTERDEALAYAAKLRDALEAYVDWCGPQHERNCPGDDTCDCKAKPYHDQVNAALNTTPPAALDEQRKREAEIRREVARECIETVQSYVKGEVVGRIIADIYQRLDLDNPSGPCADARGEHGSTEQVAGGSTPGTFDMRILRAIDEEAKEACKLAMYADDEAEPKAGRNHQWTEEELKNHAVGFAYGNLMLSGWVGTKEQLAKVYDELAADEIREMLKQEKAEPKEGSNG